MLVHLLLASTFAGTVGGPTAACALAGPPVDARWSRAVPAATEAAAPLRVVADVPLPGGASRFDYQSLEPVSGRLFIAHMGAGRLVVFDVGAERVLADLGGFPTVTGVLAVPAEGRVYASAAGEHAVVVLDDSTLETLARVPGPRFPDGIAYDPVGRRIFVSDEAGRRDFAIGARTNRVVARIELGGEAGNTRYDPGSGCVIVAVQTANELAVIDPATATVVRRIGLDRAVRYPHGVYIDAPRRLAFVAGQASATLGVLDLETLQLRQVLPIGDDPDVLDLDPGLGRLYVAAESGVVTVFEERGRSLAGLGRYRAPGAHSVAVDPGTHRVYLPLANVGGRSVLRILVPSDSVPSARGGSMGGAPLHSPVLRPVAGASARARAPREAGSTARDAPGAGPPHRRVDAMWVTLIALSLIAPVTALRAPIRAGALATLPGDSAFRESFERHGMEGWKELKLAGTSTRYLVVADGANHALQAVSAGSASALWIRVSPAVSAGTLSWRWKVNGPLSENHREREREGDDFAARLFVIFGDGELGPNTRALCYVWAAHEPVGTVYPNPRFPDVATVVVQSGTTRAGEWVSEERDWAADYERAFGAKAEPASAIAILVDTDDTGLRATAWFDDIVLR